MKTYTLNNVHPSYRVLEESIMERNGKVQVKAKCDVDLPRFYFVKNFYPRKKLFYIEIESSLDTETRIFSLRVLPMYHNFFEFFGEFYFDQDKNVVERKFDIHYHYSIRILSTFLHAKLKKLILEQIQQDFKILYSKMFV